MKTVYIYLEKEKITVEKWPGSTNAFCIDINQLHGETTFQAQAEDYAGNLSDMQTGLITASGNQYSFNWGVPQTTTSSEVLTAIVSKELNPHFGIEGMELTSATGIKQLRIGYSPELSYRAFQLSDTAMQELVGKHTIVLKYFGAYANQPHGKELHGYIYVFGANQGLVAKYKADVTNDIRLSLVEDKPTLKVMSVNHATLNTFQLHELNQALEAIKNNQELTALQKIMLHMILHKQA